MFVLQILIALASALITQLFITDLRQYLKTNFYKKQKISTNLYKGYITQTLELILSLLLCRSPRQNKFSNPKKGFKKGQRTDIVLRSNLLNGNKLELVLTDLGLVKHFLNVESEFTVKIPSSSQENLNILGFLKRSEKGVVETGRKVLKAFFEDQDHWKQFLTSIEEIVENEISGPFLKRIEKSRLRRVRANLNTELIAPLLAKFSSSILLGSDDLRDHQVNGTTFPMAVNGLIQVALIPDLANNLTFGLLRRVGFKPKLEKFSKLRLKLLKYLKKEYSRRVGLRDRGLEWRAKHFNFLDFYIDVEVARKSGKGSLQGLKGLGDGFGGLSAVLSYMEIFQFFALEKIRRLVVSFLRVLALNKNKQVTEKLLKHIFAEILKNSQNDENGDFEVFVKDKLLESSFKEVIRLSSPVPGTSFRLIFKNYKLKGIQLKKGDLISCSLNDCFKEPASIPNPEEFKPERWLSSPTHQKEYLEKIEPLLYTSGSERGCVGQGFSRVVSKAIICGILKKFRMEVIDQNEGDEEFMKYSMDDNVILRARSIQK